CSAVAFTLYKDLRPEQNPYPEKLWSRISGSRQSLYNLLSIRSEAIPSPGDLELNSNFQLVGARIDIARLEQERIESAIIDTFLQTLDSQEAYLQKYSKALDEIGNTPITAAQIEHL